MRPSVFPLVLLASALALGCPGMQQRIVAPESSPVVPGAAKEPVVVRLSQTGLGFRLSEADGAEASERPKPAATTPLTAADTKRILDRLPPFTPDPDAVKDFALRSKSIPAPRPGETVKEPFPPPAAAGAPPATVAGPLVVTRHEPDGNVTLAPYATVTFNQPMIPLTSHDDLSKTPVPITIAPAPPGTWRWVGTQTAMFAPEGRFPMATDYTVDILAGTKSATGSVLAEVQHYRFSTPALGLLDHGPTGASVKVDPTIYARFDQGIDPQAILAAMVVTANGRPVKMRLATDDEREAEDAVVRLEAKHNDTGPLSLGIGDSSRSAGGQYAGDAAKSRLIVVKPVAPLDVDAAIVVRFPAGTPSAEGPKKTASPQSFAFHTHGALRATGHTCDKPCDPFSTFQIAFSNALDLSKFDKNWVTVTPAIADMKASVYGEVLNVTGRKKGRTKYTVTVAKDVTDVFGQTLGKEDVHDFDVGPAPSALFAEDNPMIVLDPAASAAKLPIFSVNDPTLRVRLYAVNPGDYEAYARWREAWDYERKLGTPPGKVVFDAAVHPERKADELVETSIDLGPALKGGFGQVLAVVESTRPQHQDWRRQWVRQWVQMTHLGLQAVSDDRDLVVWTTRLADGAPLANVEVTCATGTGLSGTDGMARLPAVHYFIVAKKDDDRTFLPEGLTANFYRPNPTTFFTFDDRKTYKPGEDVHVKGWVRSVSYEKRGDVSLVPDAAGKGLHWVARDPRGAELSKGDATVDALGGFDFVVKTPTTANLGAAHVLLDLGPKAQGSHVFQLQEFRRPEFEVRASTSEGPNFVGEHATATVLAKYYAGGGLPNADVTWTVTRSDGVFVPPNREEYVFGKREWEGYRPRPRGSKSDRTSDTWTGHTNSEGAHHLRVDFDALPTEYPMSLSLSASVMDVNRQAWGASTTMLVHPANVYVGLKLDKPFLNAGESIQVDALVVDIDGKTVAKRPVTVTSARLDWMQTANGFEEKEVDEQVCAVTSGDVPARCSLLAKKGGQYRLKAVVVDELGRKSQTVTKLWVMDRDAPPDRSLKEDSVTIVPNKKSYAPGDTAELLVVAPFAPAEGILVIAREGIVSTERFTLATSMQTVKVKVDGGLTPNVHAYVLLAGTRVRADDTGRPDEKLPRRPAYASGTVRLSIPPVERTLKVVVHPRDKAVDPGARTTVDVDVKDARGGAVAGAEVAVVVVDEAILALSGYTLPDPLSVFYPQRGAAIAEGGTRALVSLSKPSDASLATGDELEGKGELGDSVGKVGGFGKGALGVGHGLGGATAPAAHAMPAPSARTAQTYRTDSKAAPMFEPQQPGTPIALRTNFAALAVFEPSLHTDARGHLEVPVKVPDSLTRYRVMAVAVAGENEFGSQESTITARLPVMVRPSPPRFLNFGDKFDLPIVVQNQTDRPMSVAVALRSSNANITDSPGKRVDVPPNDRVEVRFLAAADKPGKARFQVGIASGTFADASTVELPVWTPATTEAFATYGVLDAGAIAQPVKMPSGVIPQFGGLDITTSSTAMQGLTDAVLYLVKYPFECNEQVASRILAVASLRDVLSAFKNKELPPVATLEASMVTDLEKLKTHQKGDGGWAFWWGEEWPFVSIHVSHALARAEAKGYTVDPTTKQRAVHWLRNVESHIPPWYSQDARRAIVAYALYVRRLLKDADPGRARALIREYGGVDKMNLEAIGWIWPTISEDRGSQADNLQIRRVVANRVTETAGAAHFVTSYGDGNYLLLHSDRRADGVLLEAMMIDQPDSDLIPKVVKGLLAHRTAGRWGSTQENAFVLLALDKYFEKYEKTTPDFVARVWLGDSYAGEHAFKGRSTEYSDIAVPMQLLADMKQGDLTLAKDGPGRLYFRLGMQYAPSDLNPPPTEQGFTVTRRYEPVEDDGDVRRDASGAWHFKAGKKVQVRVTMVAPARRYHVALVDPIPAGVEPMNPALAITGAIPRDPNAEKNADRYWYWHSTWYEHQNMRDERVEAFASLVWEGVHEYVYTARATTPGAFVVPPPKAEEMYSPEVFGRGPTDRVIVE